LIDIILIDSATAEMQEHLHLLSSGLNLVTHKLWYANAKPIKVVCK